MAKYKAYPEYKDSGVEWLGEIPNHWKTVSISRLFSRVKRTGYTEKELLSVYRDYGVIPKSSRDDNNNKPSEDLSPYQLVQPNDLVMNKMKAWQGSIAISEYEGIVSPAYFVYQPNNSLFELAHPKYVHYLLRNPIYVTQYLSRSKGIRVNQWDLDPDEFRNIEILLPSKVEQEKIYSFLDHETAKIDNLIEKQQQLIELLNEKRQAVISQTVTKGLNLDVPMKASGVEWLGKVPDHWKLIKFSHCVSIRSGQVDPRKLPYCDYWLIAPNHIVSGEGRIINLETAKDQGADSGKYLCRTGEVIYSKIRPALVKACLSPSDKVLCSADMYPMSSYNGLTNNFLLLYLLSDAFTRFAVNQADRVAMPKINRESLSDCKIPVPPIEEQEKIYLHVREALEKLDVLLQKSQLTIEFFQERRTALISAAVTGKIDVRDWVAPDTQDVEALQEATA
ncbi:TPA: restriction endonuclease subunit S [Enterobacter cloacae]|uniref:restriction endonuclease subunit S n=1 Tax=Enterobacter cloacae TaxID=550 RepID=UPI00197EDB1A|nr:restriction endonuclease subunit S [Enterobacter cloacae]MBN4760242.1 restriction endonuclease subunit S [Enterobacter cloacae]MCT2764647.1 restriction endonuclease subunit S [Enterobacter cloacae]HDC4684269.1 restriction endonuclease subunit S [Enterobacter cloacae]